MLKHLECSLHRNFLCAMIIQGFVLLLTVWLTLGTVLSQDNREKLRRYNELSTKADRLFAQGTPESLQKAIENYQLALPLIRELGNFAANQRKIEGMLCLNIGAAYIRLEKPQEGLDYSTQALSIFRALRDHGYEARALQNIATAYINLGTAQGRLNEWKKALDYYTSALDIFRDLHNRNDEAVALQNTAAAYLGLGDWKKAIDFANQVLLLSRSIGDRQREALMLTLLAAIHKDHGELQKALDYSTQALSIVRAAGYRQGEGATLSFIGAIYASLGETQRALDYFLQALQLQRKAGDRQGEARTLNFIGAVYLSWDEKQKAVEALEYHNQALSLFRAAVDRAGEAETLMNIGNCYSALGENRKAVGVLDQALQIKRAVGDQRGEAITLAILAEAYYALNEYENAYELGKQALQLFRKMGVPQGEAHAYFRFAQAWREHGNLVEARTNIERALTLAESLRANIVSQELRASFFASVHDYYEFYIDLLMQLHKQRPSEGFDAAALQTSERARARSLLDMLSEANADIRQGADSTLVERERFLQEQLNSKAEQQMKMLAGPHSEEQASTITKEIDALVTELQQMQTHMRQNSPRYAALTQPQPLALKEIQTQVVDIDTVLLEYSLGKDRSYLWVVTPDSMTSYELPKREEIEQIARQVYDLLTDPKHWDASAQRQLVLEKSQQSQSTSTPEVAARLAQMLLGPVVPQLEKKRLLIVGDGALQYIPFAALPIPRGGANTYLPLIAEHEIVSLPSASTLAVLRSEVKDRRPAPKIFAVLADPVFERTDERITKRTKKPSKNSTNENRGLGIEVLKSAQDSGMRTNLRIPRLPGTRQEADQILSLVSPTERKQAFDFDANRATATNPDLSQYRYVHFATHGFLNSHNPELSGIVLSMFDERGQPQDGFLRAHEIFNLKLPADLIVLSACQTGLGKEVKGEGLVGLTRGFMYAGAPRVVVSLWNVSDVGTAELMTRFYRGMFIEKLPPSKALQVAQVAMFNEKRLSSPFFWGAFTLQGEWR